MRPGAWPSRPGRASRLARLLAADLRDLALDLEAGSYTRATLAMFERDLLQAVPSALGASITVQLDRFPGSPIEVHLVEHTLEPAEIVSGLRMSLQVVRQTLPGSILLYAAEQGAFDDLAADLTPLLALGPGQLDRDPELPQVAVVASVDGLEDFSVVNRAVGLLMNRGYSLHDARAELERRVAQSRRRLPDIARALLTSIG